MSITTVRPSAPPDQQVVARVAERIARGLVPPAARRPLASLLVLADQYGGQLDSMPPVITDLIAAYRPVLNPRLRNVRIQDRQHGGFPRIVTVSVPWVCPTCGGERGEPFETEISMFGSPHRIDEWRNECGHVDHHYDVVREYERYRELVDVDQAAVTGAEPVRPTTRTASEPGWVARWADIERNAAPDEQYAVAGAIGTANSVARSTGCAEPHDTTSPAWAEIAVTAFNNITGGSR